MFGNNEKHTCLTINDSKWSDGNLFKCYQAWRINDQIVKYILNIGTLVVYYEFAKLQNLTL